MVMESITPPNGDFSNRELQEIQEEIGYWNTGTMEIAIARTGVSTFPIPIKLYFKDRDNKVWQNYGSSLVERGLAEYGSVDLTRFDFFLHARGIDVARKRHGC